MTTSISVTFRARSYSPAGSNPVPISVQFFSVIQATAPCVAGRTMYAPVFSAVDPDAEGPADNKRNLWTPAAWISAFQLQDRNASGGPLGLGVPLLRDEKSRRYLGFFWAW